MTYKAEKLHERDHQQTADGLDDHDRGGSRSSSMRLKYLESARVSVSGARLLIHDHPGGHMTKHPLDGARTGAQRRRRIKKQARPAPRHDRGFEHGVKSPVIGQNRGDHVGDGRFLDGSFQCNGARHKDWAAGEAGSPQSGKSTVADINSPPTKATMARARIFNPCFSGWCGKPRPRKTPCSPPPPPRPR